MWPPSICVALPPCIRNTFLDNAVRVRAMYCNGKSQNTHMQRNTPLCSTRVHVFVACNTFPGQQSIHTPLRQKYIKVAALIERSYSRSTQKHCTFTTSAPQIHSASLLLHYKRIRFHYFCTTNAFGFTATSLHNGCKRPK